MMDLSARGFFVALVLGGLVSSTCLQGSDRTRASRELPATEAGQLVPEHILKQAQQLGIAASDISLQGDRWVGCRHDDAKSCVALGAANMTALSSRPISTSIALASSDVLQIHQYGKEVRYLPASSLKLQPNNELGRLVMTKASSAAPSETCFELQSGVAARVSLVGKSTPLIDTLPRFQREASGLVRTKDYALVREYLDAHPSEPFMVVVTVPALCAPCRQMDQVLHDSLAQRPAAAAPMKTFILEYFNFADAEREVLGSGAIFPTTLVFEPRVQPRQSIARVIGDLHGASLEEVGRPLRQRLARGAPHTLTRGLLSRELLQSLRP